MLSLYQEKVSHIQVSLIQLPLVMSFDLIRSSLPAFHNERESILILANCDDSKHFPRSMELPKACFYTLTFLLSYILFMDHSLCITVTSRDALFEYICNAMQMPPCCKHFANMLQNIVSQRGTFYIPNGMLTHSKYAAMCCQHINNTMHVISIGIWLKHFLQVDL